MSDYIDDVFGLTGALAQRFPGYSPRPGQVAMARAVDLAIREGSHLVVEAGTGTGKSVAYAVPAIYHVTHPQSRSPVAPPPPMPDDFDPDEVGEASVHTRCSVCSRSLSDSESIELGIGPECRRKYDEKGVDYPSRNDSGEVKNSRVQASKRSRAVIVTANIALQEQLVRKDLPLLQEVLPWKFSYALLKGMGNYLCRDKLENQPDVFTEDVKMAGEIRAWSKKTETGDKSELAFDPPQKLWSQFSVSSDECSGQLCDHHPTTIERKLRERKFRNDDDGDYRIFEPCFSKVARTKARSADVIVTNYALFFLDILVRVRSLGNASILPGYSIAILDEGHKAADIARDFFGWRVTAGAIDWGGQMLPHKDRIELQKQQSIFFSALREYRRSREYKARIKKPNVVASKGLTTQLDRAVGVYEQELEDEDVTQLDKDQQKKHRQKERKRGRLAQLSDQIKEAMRLYAPPAAPWVEHPDSLPGSTPHTRWYHSDPALGGDNTVKSEVQILAINPQIKDIYFIEEDKERVVLSSMPVSVAEYLREMLFRVTPSISVTSATLVARSSFDFITDDLGIVESSKPAMRTLMAESPFDWRAQALLVLPSGLPEPNEANFTGVVVERLAQTIDLARGRTLGLFTSYKNMNAAHEYLKKKCVFRVLKQGDMPRTKLVDEFRKDVSSVLLGVESFWAGVDVQGESLSCVFIDRLPFATPDDPLLDALAERDRAGWFMKYSVPQAIIAFKQGFGRLIRTTTDKGVVVLCDRRVTTKKYGSLFLQSLPPVMQSSDLGDVRRFLDGEPLLGLRRASPGRSLFDGI